LITATPRALVADIAKLAKVAQVAEKVGNGAITRDMLSSEVLAQLDANATVSPSAPITITRDMLPQDVRDDLNKSSTTASPITLSMLAPEVTAKLDQNVSGGSGVVAGSLISIPSGQSAPAGYSLYQRGEPKELVWEEKAPLNKERFFFGIEKIDNLSYVFGGVDSNLTGGITVLKSLEIFDSVSNSWKTSTPMTTPRFAFATAVLDEKIYAIGGSDETSVLKTVEIFDPKLDSWYQGISLPTAINNAKAISVEGKIYLVGGSDNGTSTSNKLFCFDSLSNQWKSLANMPTARTNHELILFENRIWAIGGQTGNNLPLAKVESYDPQIDYWQSEAPLIFKRIFPFSWKYNGKIYVCGGISKGIPVKSIESYEIKNNQWQIDGNFSFTAINSGKTFSNHNLLLVGVAKDELYQSGVVEADLNASVAGIYDLYRKDGNASAGTSLVQAEVADGSVTTSKIASNAITTNELSEQILKYLKPEITSQPQAQTVYADSNVSFSVTAEGKYLTYQWKKDGSDLTGENNATLTITDANATQHDGNYSVVVSNDFGSVESNEVLLDVNTSLLGGLVGWWKFDETNGTIAYDSSGNGNDGNLTNGPAWVSGKIDGALSFDGVDDYVNLSQMQLGSPLSISFFAKYSSFNNYSRIIDFASSLNSGNNHIIIANQTTNSTSRIHIFNGTTDIKKIDISNFWYLNQWQHIVLTVSSDGIYNVFSDGQKIHESNGQQIDVKSRIYHFIGKSTWSGDGYYAGLIDDVRIYDRALSADEVQSLYNMGQ
jgi:N-acetylneuraminic acid mutarotase